MKAASVAAPYPVPNRPVTVVTGKRCERLGPEEARSDQIGLKVMGLLRIPQPWVPAFFVVSADKAPTVSAILAAGRTVGTKNISNVYVRSRGTRDGIEERVSLGSQTWAVVDYQ